MTDNTDKIMNCDLSTLLKIVSDEVDGIFIVDYEKDKYQAVKHNDMLSDLFHESGSYLEFSKILMFHFNDRNADIIKKYHVFLPKLSKLKGKYSRRMTIFYKNEPVLMQVSIYPLKGTGKHVIFLTQLDNSEYVQEFFTWEKEHSLQSNYLFTMYVDLIKDTCNSVCISEISDDTMNCDELKYSQWRTMIVNMIYPDDQPMFLKYTDPDYIKSHLKSRRSSSFDCQMQNLQGQYIWVKIILNKIQTFGNNDFRFVYMVQDIHESSMKLIQDLKKYEELSNLDSLTRVFNHGKIENELYKYVKLKQAQKIDLSLIMLDLDFFKKINDTFGHATGDSVLKQLVSVISDYLHEYNITLGRWGGEEFIAICFGIDKPLLYNIAEGLRKHIEDFDFQTAGHITCSIGVIEINDGESETDAFRRVDKALYTAKSNGRNCIVCG